MWWFQDALPKTGGSRGPDAEDEFVSAALEGQDGPDHPPGDGQALSHCHWLWLLFRSPFPTELMLTHPAVTLKHWRTLCTILSSRGLVSGNVSLQLHYFALIANKISKLLLKGLEDSGRQLSDVDERNVVYTFALQVPTLTSMCTVLQQATTLAKDSHQHISASAKASMDRCVLDLQQVFTAGLQHQNVKVVQTTISSMQNLLQNSSCTFLFPIIMPALFTSVAKQPSTLPVSTVESAWNVLSSVYGGLQALDTPELVGATTQLVVRLVSAITNYSGGAPGSFGAQHTAAMAQCLLQVARLDQQGLKTEIAALPGEGQQTIQALLQNHMSASQAARPTGMMAAAPAEPAKAKIELKLKF